ARARGDTLVRSHCPTCLALLSDLSGTAALTDDSLNALLASPPARIPGVSDLVAAVAFARSAAAAEYLGGDRAMEVTRTLDRTGRELDRAVQLAQAGRRKEAVGAGL